MSRETLTYFKNIDTDDSDSAFLKRVKSRQNTAPFDATSIKTNLDSDSKFQSKYSFKST